MLKNTGPFSGRISRFRALAAAIFIIPCPELWPVQSRSFTVSRISNSFSIILDGFPHHFAYHKLVFFSSSCVDWMIAVALIYSPLFEFCFIWFSVWYYCCYLFVQIQRVVVFAGVILLKLRAAIIIFGLLFLRWQHHFELLLLSGVKFKVSRPCFMHFLEPSWNLTNLFTTRRIIWRIKLYIVMNISTFQSNFFENDFCF